VFDRKKSLKPRARRPKFAVVSPTIFSYCPAMKRSKRDLTWLAGLILLAGASANVLADTKANPYEPILVRNPFGLKPPPPPDPDAGKPPPPPPPPLATVELTGITSILSSKRALLEIIPGPGKPMLKPILAEGERVESVEVVSINVDKNEVTVKNGGVVTNLTFKVAKSSPAAAAAGVPPPPGAIPGQIPRPGVPVPPVQTSFNNPSYNNNSGGGGRNAVMMAGGESAAPASTGAPALGGASVNANAPTLGSGMANDGAFRSIPSRNIRTQQPQQVLSPEEQVLEIENNRRLNQQSPVPMPPLPPTPLTPPQSDYQNNPTVPTPGGPTRRFPNRVPQLPPLPGQQ